MKTILLRILLTCFGLFEFIWGILFLINPGAYIVSTGNLEAVSLVKMFGIAIMSIAVACLASAYWFNKLYSKVIIIMATYYNFIMSATLWWIYGKYHLTGAIFGGAVGSSIHSIFFVLFFYFLLSI